MSKRILVITDNLRNQINGVVTTFNQLVHQANKDNYEMLFISPGDFHHISCPGYNEIKLAWPWAIGDKIACLNPDYIHIATEGPIGLAARLWLDRKGWRYNTSFHTKFPEFLKKIYHIPEWITYLYLRWFHKHSGRVLVTTETMKKELTQQGFSPDLIVWSRGVNSNIFGPMSRNSKTLTEPKILLNVGRVSKEKGLDDFCNLRIPNTKKIVVGDGPYLKELKNKYTDVEFVGAHRGIELANYFANADVFVFPSKTDTFGIVIIESLRCGTPVAAYPVAGPIDIIEQNKNGVLDFDLTQAVLKCFDLDRSTVYLSSRKWTWEKCWSIFKDNLVNKY